MVTMLKNRCSVWKRIKFPTFWYNYYYFTWSDTYFIQLETLLINHPSYFCRATFLFISNLKIVFTFYIYIYIYIYIYTHTHTHTHTQTNRVYYCVTEMCYSSLNAFVLSVPLSQPWQAFQRQPNVWNIVVKFFKFDLKVSILWTIFQAKQQLCLRVCSIRG